MDFIVGYVSSADNQQAGVERDYTPELGQPVGLPGVACSLWLSLGFGALQFALREGEQQLLPVIFKRWLLQGFN